MLHACVQLPSLPPQDRPSASLLAKKQPSPEAYIYIYIYIYTHI